MHDLSPTDRRSAPRIAINQPVELQFERASSSVHSTALNLSATGMCCSGVGGADVGDAVRCRLLFTPQEPLALSARVVWSAPDEHLGLQFEEITDHRGQRLLRYLRRVQGAVSSTLPGLRIDPFCESGTWSREILVDEELYEATAETRNTHHRHYRFLWGVALGALIGGAAAALVAAALAL